MFEEYKEKHLFRGLFSNPIGIIFLVVHWLIAVAALMHLQFDGFDKIQPGAVEAIIILGALFILNLPAILPAAILLYPIRLFSESYFIIVALVSFFTISLQWLIIGRKIYRRFWLKETEFVNLQITDKGE